MRIFWLVIVFLVVFVPKLYAQDALIKEAIEAFYPQKCALQASGAEAVVLESFFEKHLHADVAFTLFIKGFSFGIAVEPRVLPMNKAEAISSLVSAAGNNKIDKIECYAEDVQINPDGKGAVVKAFEFAETKNTQSDGKTLRSTQQLKCTDELILSEQKLIQIKKSTCDVVVKMEYVQTGKEVTPP